jgi:hypothetical protein
MPIEFAIGRFRAATSKTLLRQGRLTAKSGALQVGLCINPTSFGVLGANPLCSGQLAAVWQATPGGWG